MKKTYDEAEIEIIAMYCVDILTESDPGEEVDVNPVRPVDF